MRLSAFLAVLLLSGAATAAKPNVVVILADDQGWGDLSVHGNTNLKTPNIDSLAKDGVLFERLFVCPVCSPTRAEFLTGRYHPRGGVRDVSTGGERLNLEERTIADHFKAAGYKTATFGKWHNGTQYPYHPNGRGFDEYYGFTSGHWGDYFGPPLDHNGEQVRGKGYITDDLTDHARSFATANKDKPFFCYLALNTPHSPMQVPDPSWDRFKNAELKLRATPGTKEDLPHTRAALAMCENIDDNVGRLLKMLDELKIADNTIVLYFSDNGPNGFRWNDGMKGRKGSTDEGGVRSPLLMRWPGHIPSGTRIPQIAGAIDLLPTLAELSDVKLAGGKPLDGTSLASLLLGKKVEWSDRTLFSHWNGKVSARTQQYRLDAAGKLFDMVKDPGQLKDVTAEQAGITKQLTSAVEVWKQDVLPGIAKKDDRPFTVGYHQFPIATLPARDGVPHGKVQRSAKAPNCSYFTNWISKDDSMTWEIETATAGRYEAVVYYTCSKADVGSTVELGFQNARFTGTITEAHDPPLMGDEHDRTPRAGESYVKDFKPLSLGIVELPKGRGPLTLKATKVTGKQVMDVRSVVLTLQK